MKIKIRILSRLCVVLLFSSAVHSQTASFLAGGIDEFLRRSQLTGPGSLQNSFTIRSFNKSMEGLDSSGIWTGAKIHSSGMGSSYLLLPVSMEQQFNSGKPYGWNDGSMIPAKGVSVKASVGIRATMGRFSIQLQPEIVQAQNSPFETFFTIQHDTTWSRYYKWLNRYDIPERFGTGSYHKIFGGQSSIRYNGKKTSAGISTESLWWGPGTRNALVMSNNAPGFLHLTYNTTRPVQTKIGSFEWQIIGGILENSGILPPESGRSYTTGSSLLYVPKNEETRYLTGMVLSWQPRWVKGLFLGFAKASYLYNSDISGIADILPLQGLVSSASEKNGHKASLGSLFARYIMPEEKAEIYMEYGRNDKSADPFNVVADSRYPRAYIAGFRKLFATKRSAFIEFAAELTQMQLPAVPDLIHNAESFYTHGYVRQGYTNMGQVIGAGIGPGSNSEMVSLAWVKGLTRVGILFERVLHNNDFYYDAFEESIDFRRHWVDISTTLSADWSYHRFLFSTQIALARSLNYEWLYIDYLPLTSPANYFKNGYDVLNFQAKFSFAYRL